LAKRLVLLVPRRLWILADAFGRRTAGLAIARYREGLKVTGTRTERRGEEKGRLLHTISPMLWSTWAICRSANRIEVGLKIVQDLRTARPRRHVGHSHSAMKEGDLNEALARWRKALALFRQLGEPPWKRLLGINLDWSSRRRSSGRSRKHYRESARIAENMGISPARREPGTAGHGDRTRKTEAPRLYRRRSTDSEPLEIGRVPRMHEQPCQPSRTNRAMSEARNWPKKP